MKGKIDRFEGKLLSELQDFGDTQTVLCDSQRLLKAEKTITLLTTCATPLDFFRYLSDRAQKSIQLQAYLHHFLKFGLKTLELWEAVEKIQGFCEELEILLLN